MQINAEDSPPTAEVLDLYDAVGWAAYTRDPQKLARGIAGSHLVLTARDEAGRLLGLARTVSDGETVCYVQDILVRPDSQRLGIGRALMQELIGRYGHCRSFVLSTDAADSADAQVSHPFYRSLGLVPHREQGLEAFGLPAGG